MNTHMTSPILKTVNLSKSFGALQASNKVSLDLFNGEIHALIGPNGAGKSTLIKQISGSLKSDEGTVYISGTDVTHLDTAGRAKMGLARTFQVSALAMEDTVLQNVLLGALGAHGQPLRPFGAALKNNALLEPALLALERIGLQDKASTRTSELSHGQRRQLEIAVALTLKPKAFVMDEPMAGLGTSGTQKLTHFLSELRHEAPILMVEHDMDAVFALADRISVLVYGEIIATGSVEEIRANADVRSAYLGSDA